MQLAALLTGTVTFLFTDMEGSTRLWERFPDVMSAAVARHDAILRTAIEANQGYVFKTVGDAFCAVFETAPAALRAAIALQLAVGSEAYGAVDPLRVRAALHTGAADERDSDYFGPTVNRVARLLTAGHGGQILVSLPTYELIRDRLPDGVSLRDVGEHRLKDLSRPERVYQVAAPDLPAEFLALKSPDSHPNNLPVQPTPLVGREREVAAATGRLRGPEVRLLTLTGPGGIGKTRLALQAAAELAGNFDHGVFFVSLGSVADPALVAPAIAQVLALRESPGQIVIDRLKEGLRDRQILLVLDNFEHLDKAVGVVADLLPTCPRLKILVTSRGSLHLRGEHELVVPPLTLPDPEHLPPLADIEHFEAIRLFVERAQAVRADFRLTSQNAAAVIGICRHLDGLPLAIELAAARIRMLAPSVLLARLQRSLTLLTGGARDLPARQQTMRETIAWSYDLLLDREKALFRRLAVFVAGCTLEAAEAVATDSATVLDDLESLVNQSLVRHDEAATGESRFAMLETTREYAAEKLRECGDEASVRSIHAEYFLGYGEWSEQNEVSLELDRDNYRAALRWFEETGRVAEGVRLIRSVLALWTMAGPFSEGRDWLTRFLAAPSFSMAAIETRAMALYAEVRMELRRDPVATRNCAGELLALGRETGNPGWIEFGLAGLYFASLDFGEYERADREAGERLELGRAIGHSGITISSWIILGDVARLKGDDDLAYSRYFESLEYARSLLATEPSAASRMHWQLTNLGYVAVHRGDFAEARARFRESMGLIRGREIRVQRVECLIGFAALFVAEGNTERGARLLGAVDAALETIGVRNYAGARFEHERTLRALRSTLSEPALRRSLAEGHASTLEQAVADAIREETG